MQRAAAGCQADRGYQVAVDPEDPVVAEGPAGDTRVGAEQVPGLGRRDERELKVDRGVPGLAVEPRGVHQGQQVRAERERRGHREHRRAMVPASAARTGTADLPRPGSRARRTPAVMVTGAPAPASHPASRSLARQRPAASRPAAAAPTASRQAGQAAQATSSPTMATAARREHEPVGADPGSRARPAGRPRSASAARPRPPPRPPGPPRPAVATATSISPAASELAAGHAQGRQHRVARGRPRPAAGSRPGRRSAARYRPAPARRWRARPLPGGSTARSAATCGALVGHGRSGPRCAGNRRASACASTADRRGAGSRAQFHVGPVEGQVSRRRAGATARGWPG